MAEQEYFQKALANFMFDTASGGAIRHLADLGFTVEQIRKHLDFPTPYERIRQTVWEHFLDTGVLRLEEPGAGGRRERYEYVAEYDQYGKKSFRRVTLESDRDEEVSWKVRIFPDQKGEIYGLSSCLEELCGKNGEDTAYVSCDFGLRSKREPEKYRAVLGLLEKNDREYVEGIPWERRKVYHRLNKRMRDIAVRLWEQGEFSGVFYFMDMGEKIVADK